MDYNKMSPQEFDEAMEKEFFYEGSPINMLVEAAKVLIGKEWILVPNKKRLSLYRGCYIKLKKLYEQDEDVTVTCEPSPLIPTCLSIIVETFDFSFNNTNQIADIISKADQFEAIALTNGSVRVIFSFNDCMIELN